MDVEEWLFQVDQNLSPEGFQLLKVLYLNTLQFRTLSDQVNQPHELHGALSSDWSVEGEQDGGGRVLESARMSPRDSLSLFVHRLRVLVPPAQTELRDRKGLGAQECLDRLPLGLSAPSSFLTVEISQESKMLECLVKTYVILTPRPQRVALMRNLGQKTDTHADNLPTYQLFGRFFAIYKARIAEGVDVRGYQVELAFDTAALRYVLSADGGYLPAGAFVMPPVVNGNRVTFGATSLQKSSEGDGTLAAFTFEVLTASPAMPTLSDVKLTDSNADFLAVQIELGEVTDSPQLAGDVNGDGVVDLLDMTAAAVLLSQTGENTADMNGDGVVDAVDLVLIAAAIEAAAAAPSLHPSVVIEMFTATEVRQWLSFARVEGLTGGRYQQGFLLLEQLLLILTPEETALLANYPNPFNPETWIPYQLSESADVTISIYAADGRLVRVLSLGHQGAGIYESRSRAGYWDGRNALGEPVASGVYFYTFTAGEFTATRKMLIRK